MGVVVDELKAGDIPAVVPVHREAFDGYMNAKLGDAYTAAFFRWFVGCSQVTIRIVVRDDVSEEVLGYVVGTTRETEASLVRALVPHAVAGMIRRPTLLLDRKVQQKVMARLHGMFNREPGEEARLELPAPTMGLIAIGVSRAARGRSIGRTLMAGFEAQARAMKMASMFLSVYTENAAARRLYESCGWSVPPGEFFGGKAHYYVKLVEPLLDVSQVSAKV